MSEKTITEKAFESIRGAVSDPAGNSAFTWEAAGEILGILAIAMLTLWCVSEAKKVKTKKRDKDEN